MDDHHEQLLDDVSVASSVPTDLSISEVSDLKFDQHQKKLSLKAKKQQQREKEKIARQLLEKKQLEHDLQLVKIELNQKEYLLENAKTEYQMRLEDLEEKLQECRHQKQILLAKSESQLAIHQEEAKRKQDKLQGDLSVIKVRLRDLETANGNLTRKTGEIKQQLREHVDIDDDKYYELRGMSDDVLSVKDLIAMKVFESLRPYKIELDELKSRCERMSNSLDDYEKRADSYKQELDDERKAHATLQVKLSQVVTHNQDLEVRATNKDYRINNYDRVNQERDELERLVKELTERNTVLEREFSSADRDKKHFEQEYNTAKSSLTLMTQDKDYLTRQVCELTNKLAYAEERLQRQTTELDDVKKGREELFEKYVSSRDQYKTQYEQQLQAELRHMSASTQEEVEKLRATTKAMYEMESRTLKESRDVALAERDKALSQEADLQTRYHQLNDLYRQEKITLETRVSELSSEMKMAEYEKSRAQLLHEETNKNLKDCQLENDKMLKKLEVTNKEYYNMEMQYTRRVSEYESRVKEYETRLQAYENIEKELDEVIMQAAEVDSDEGAEKVMLSYGYGASIPSSSQRRMKQSVHLARRCLALERQMVGDKRQIKELEEAVATLKTRLKSADEKINSAEQPYSYLLTKTQQLESHNHELKKKNQSLDSDIKAMSRKYHNAAADVKRLTEDLEAACRHGDEITAMKEQLNSVLSKSTRDTKELLMSEMSTKERVLRAKRLIEQGHPGGLREAEDLLKPVNLGLNPATKVIESAMSPYEAVLYLDSVLRNLSSPVKLKGKTAGVRDMTRARSQPTGGAAPTSKHDFITDEQPQPISMRRKQVQAPQNLAIRRL